MVMSCEIGLDGWPLSTPNTGLPQDPLVAVGGLHGKEDAALEVVKTALRVPNVVPMLASIHSILAGQRWIVGDENKDGDRNMSGQIPGSRHSPLYNGQRAWMLDQRLGELAHSDVLEFHSSIDTVDFGWVYVEPPKTTLHISNVNFQGVAQQVFGEYTHNLTVLKLLRLGIRDFVVSNRKFNLFGHYMNAGLIDIGINSPWRDRQYARELLYWMANEYDPSLDSLYGSGYFDLGDLPEARLYSHVGWVPHKERKRVDLPENMETLEPIDPEKAEALGLPPGAMAVSWKRGLPQAGEVFVPYRGHLPGLLGKLAISGRLPKSVTHR